MDEKTSGLFFALLKNEICGKELSDEEKSLVTEDVIKALYQAAKTQDLAHLISDALFKNGLLNKDMVGAKAFLRQQQTAVFRYEQIRFELEELCAVLEETRIAYMPLKGSVLRAYYPEPWMRTSCDIDIYVQKSDLKKAVAVITEKLGYTNEELGGTHDVSLYSPSGVHLELHFDLIEDYLGTEVARELEKVWEESVPVKEGAYQRRARDEGFYFYHVAHMAKHFKNGGCGVRPFIDLWIMNAYMPCEKAILSEKLQVASLTAFYDGASRLCDVWFLDKEHDDLTAAMEEFLFKGGVFGTTETRVQATLNQKQSKGGYVLSRIFLSYKEIKARHPSVAKFPPLYLFFTVKRWFNLLFVRGRAKNSLRELNALKAEKGDDRKDLMFTYLGV